MKLIVGLGNPGKEFEKTRHNIGFMTIDNYINNIEWQSKFNSLIYKTRINNIDVIFAKPQTYMNLSGIAVKEIVDYYDIALDDILIIHDDLDLDLGCLRIKSKSSSGGHNGIKSIINELGTNMFGRLKVGISHNENIPTDKYVVGKFSTDDLELLSKRFDICNKIIEDFINNDINYIVSRYNNHEL